MYQLDNVDIQLENCKNKVIGKKQLRSFGSKFICLIIRLESVYEVDVYFSNKRQENWKHYYKDEEKYLTLCYEQYDGVYNYQEERNTKWIEVSYGFINFRKLFIWMNIQWKKIQEGKFIFTTRKGLGVEKWIESSVGEYNDWKIVGICKKIELNIVELLLNQL